MIVQVALLVVAGNRIAVVHVPCEAFTNEELEERIKVSVMRASGVERVAMMMLDENENPTFMGSRDEVNVLVDSEFHNYPWEEFRVPPE